MYDPGNPIVFDFANAYTPPAGNAIEFRLGDFGQVCEIFIPARGIVHFNLDTLIDADADGATLDFLFADKCYPPTVAEEEPGEPGEESQAVGGTRFYWRKLTPMDRSLRCYFGAMVMRDREARVYQAKLPAQVDKTIRSYWMEAIAVDTTIRAGWGDAPAVRPPETRLAWYNPPPSDTVRRTGWRRNIGIDRRVAVRWYGRCNYLDFSCHLGWCQSEKVDETVSFHWKNKLPARDVVKRYFWGRQLYERICKRGYAVPPGREIHFDFGTELVHVGDKRHLDFYFTSMSYDLRCHQREPSGWRDPNNWRDPVTWPVTPKLECFYIMNTAYLTRISDLAPVQVRHMEVAADLDSWCWRFTARVPAASLSLVAYISEPVAVRVEINGWQWVVLIESWSESSRFGNKEYTIKGRSESAVLGDQYAPARSGSNSLVTSSKQLAEAELTNTGWTIDWSVVDWLVDPGALTYSNLSPVKIIQKIVEAPGGRLISHRSNKQLIALPRLHSLPWTWPAATPDLTISDYVVRQLGREFVRGFGYNAVFVSGENQGVLAKVYRSGTAGDLVAPMVTDALITDVEPARERGKDIIGRSGKWSRESLELPLTYDGDLPGLLELGQLVSMDEAGVFWRGQVGGVRVVADMTKGFTVSQYVDIERYYGD